MITGNIKYGIACSTVVDVHVCQSIRHWLHAGKIRIANFENTYKLI